MTKSNKEKGLNLLQKIRDRKFRLDDGNIDWDAVENARKEAVRLLNS